MRYQGRITTWKDDKGFGFITPNGGGEQVFMHISAFSNRQQRPTGNELVTYELAMDDKGRPRAKSVAFVGARIAPPASEKPVGKGRGNIAPILAIVFMVFLAAAVVSGRLPSAVLLLYIATSGVTYLAYVLDKSAAKRGEWRTKESTLHLFSLLGGWPGALAAQRLLRHKSVKSSFQTTFWITVMLNCAACGWLLSPSGAKTLQVVLGAL